MGDHNLASCIIVFKTGEVQSDSLRHSVHNAAWHEASLSMQAAPVEDSIANMANNVTRGAYGINASALNLDPRQLATLALQPLWDNNQKLELLRIACEARLVLVRVLSVPWV